MKETVVVRICDKCKGTEDVTDLTVVYGYGTNKPWEVDLCGKCYRQVLGGLEAKSRPPEIKNVRPQHRFKKTDISEDVL